MATTPFMFRQKIMDSDNPDNLDNPNNPENPDSSGYGAFLVFKLLLILTPLALIMLYVLFQRHKLPPSVGKYIAKLFFYPTLPITYVTKHWSGHYWDLIDENVFLGAVPIVCVGHVSELHKMGVRAVVNMCDEYEGPVKAYEKFQITQLHLPTVDHVEPSVDNMHKAVDFISDQIRTGNKVYIHCKGGHGRAAAIAFAWLLYSQRLSLMEVQERLNAFRKVRNTLHQQEHIVKFYEEITR